MALERSATSEVFPLVGGQAELSLQMNNNLDSQSSRDVVGQLKTFFMLLRTVPLLPSLGSV